MATAPALRQAEWLTGARARAWCRLLAGMSAIGVAATLALSHGGLDPGGKPLGTDFVSFYAAARLAASDGAAAAYDVARHAAAQRAVFPGVEYGYTTFLYPPTFLLLCLPLAALPYAASLAAWLAGGLALLLAALSRILPAGGLLPLLSFPALLLNAGHGQNACLTAAAFAGYMALGEATPLAAGACLGLLLIKPHLALAVPVVLLCGRRWRALAGAAFAGGALVLASAVLLGPSAWTAFLAAAPAGTPMLLHGLNGFSKMPSLFAGLRLLGLGIAPALVAQAALALLVLATAAVLATRRLSAGAEGALMASAALLVSPWSFDYDFLLLAPPLAWLCASGVATGFLPWEKLTLLAAYVLPLFARVAATGLGVPLGPPVLLLLFWAVCRRAAAA